MAERPDDGPASTPQAGLVDLRGAAFDAVVRFVFDHPAPRDPHDRDWDFREDLEIVAEPIEQVQFMTELFRAPLPALSCFSDGQLEQGFWFLFGPGGADHFTRHLNEASVPVEARIACVEAIADLYAQLFACLEHADEPRALRAYLERADLDEEHRQAATRLLGAPPRPPT
jgi:hypothetical protein